MERREITEVRSLRSGASCLAMTPTSNKPTKKALCIFLAVEQRTGRQTKLMFHLTKPIL